ncbi:MAG: glycosyltransferase family 4 protein [Planktotalea sp.]|uniref:glycosyltransferase family 4 protein n=1 Tax=Planktotalea sp. TaxID=2029877 RepID=UPI003C77F942
MSNPPRVLIIAEAANPEWVSVPLVGWSLARAIKDKCNAHIVTQIRNRDAFLRAGMVEGTDFTAIDSEAFARPLWAIGEKLRMGEGKGWTTLQLINAISYPYFERLIWKQFGGAIRAGEYDIVHRVTPLSPTIISPIARKCAKAGVPFVLGPLNGGVPWPKGFDSERRREREWLSYLRSGYKALPGRTSTLKHAAAILTGSRHTASEMPARFAEKCIYMPENGIDPARFSGVANPAETGPLRACFVGRMVPYKGPDMLLEAAAPLLDSGALEIEMIGDGPMLEPLKAEHSKGVHWHGWMAHEEVQSVLKTCHLLSFPSIREFGGGVVLEAMALGVPPLIVDYAGPGELVEKDWGIKVPIGTRDEIITRFRDELTALCADPGPLAPMRAAAAARIESHFTWERKAEQMLQVYEWIANGGPAPRFF